MINECIILMWITVTVIMYFFVLVMAYLEAKFKNKNRHYTELMFRSNNDYSAKNIYLTYDTEWFLAPFLSKIAVGVLIGSALYVLQYDFGIFNIQLDINGITDVVMGLSSIVIGVVCVVVTLVKKYYLFFSIEDVFQFYKVPQYTTAVIITMIGDIVIRVLELNVGNILIYSLICSFTTYNIYCGARILFKTKQILFGEKIELSLLRELYKVFWYNKIDLTNFGDEEYWNKDSVYINLDYLLGCYFNNNINKVDSIEFVSTLGEIKQKYNKRVICILAVNNCLLILVLFLQGDLGILTKMQICTLFGVTIFCILGPEEIKLAIITILIGTRGYALKKKNGKYVIVPEGVLFSRKKYRSFVEDMNSVCALFYIWVKRNENQDLSACKQEFIEFINRLDENGKSLSYKYLPVFTIGFFLWDRDLSVEEVKQIYDRFSIDKERSAVLQKMIYSQIIYVTRNFEGKSREKLDDYLLWPKGC